MARVIINSEMCKGCGLCVAACPKKILELDRSHINTKGYNSARNIKPEACIGCAMCARMCPDVCIEVEK